MHIELSDEQKMLRDEVRRFAEEVVKPIAKEVDAEGRFPTESMKPAAEMGLMGVAVPEEWGGAGMDVLSYCIVIEEVSRVCGSTGVILSVNNSLVCDPILKFGNDDQKERFLKPLAAGELLGCFGLTEPGAGS
ncbi:MAG: acyl-CoA dehydrogenase family protein, partial [Acidobacteriota bacterium]